MRYPAKKWKSVAILMRDSSYSVMEALIEGDKGWTDLRDTVNLTDGGLQKVLKELIKVKIVDEVFVKKSTGFKEKKYAITKSAKKEQIYQKAKNLKESLEKVAVK